MAAMMQPGSLVIVDSEQLYATFGDAEGISFGLGRGCPGCDMTLQVDTSRPDLRDTSPGMWPIQFTPPEQDVRVRLLWHP